MINAALSLMLLSGTEPVPMEAVFDACLKVATDLDPAEISALDYQPTPNRHQTQATLPSDLGPLFVAYDQDWSPMRCNVSGGNLWLEDQAYPVTWNIAGERALLWLHRLASQPGFRFVTPKSVYDDPSIEYCAPGERPLVVEIGATHSDDESGDYHVPFRPDGAIWMVAYRDPYRDSCE